MNRESRGESNQISTASTSAPRDVVHIRLGSILLVFCFAVGVISALTGVWWVTGIAVVVLLVFAVDVWRIVRRRPTDDA